MRGVSTFGAFTTARLGIYAAQKALDVTGHNITNINTPGYTRQRLDQMALRVGGKDRYVSSHDVYVGNGVLCTGVSQLRDPYLDIRYRDEMASVGAMDEKLSQLEQLAGVLDEVYDGKDHSGVLEAHFNEFVTALQDLTKYVGQVEYDSLARGAAEDIAKDLNDYANRLARLESNLDESFRQDVSDVNTTLAEIRNLNESIFKSELRGDDALELKDQRNLLLDQLSQYMKISVSYESVDVGGGESVDKLVVQSIPDGDGERHTLVDGNYAAQLSVTARPKRNPAYDPADPTAAPQYLTADGTPTDVAADAEQIDYYLDLSALTDKRGKVLDGSLPVQVGDADLYGSLQASREMLTRAGAYATESDLLEDKDAAIKQGIPFYQHALDSLAQKLAQVLNGANNGYLMDGKGNYVDRDTGVPLEVGGAPIHKDDVLTPDQEAMLADRGMKLGGNLFSNSSNGDDDTGITAANISISKSWGLGNVRIVNSFQMGSLEGGAVGPNSTDATNILHMKNLMEADNLFLARDVVVDAAGGDKAMCTGSFQEMLAYISVTLAGDQRVTSTMLENYVTSSNTTANSRDSVSGVDLNDEATGLMQYQKSYSAACRLMTTMDEVLDKLINGTGVVGR